MAFDGSQYDITEWNVSYIIRYTIYVSECLCCFIFRKETINMFWRPGNKKNDVIGGTQVTILELLPTQSAGPHRIRATMVPSGNKSTCPGDTYEMHTLAPVPSSALI